MKKQFLLRNLFRIELIISVLLSPIDLYSSDYEHITINAMAQSNQDSLTFDDFINQAFRSNKDSYFDAETNSWKTSSVLFIDIQHLPVTEIEKLNLFLETGIWISEGGIKYDLKASGIFVKDGKNDHAHRQQDSAAFNRPRAYQDPFAFEYPASPYVNKMTPSQFVEALLMNVSKKNPVTYYIDGASGAIFVPTIVLPLQGLPYKFSLEVIGIIVSGQIWTSPSGRLFDLRQTSFVFPGDEIGTDEERSERENRFRGFVDYLKADLKKPQPLPPEKIVRIDGYILTTFNTTFSCRDLFMKGRSR